MTSRMRITIKIDEQEATDHISVISVILVYTCCSSVLFQQSSTVSDLLGQLGSMEKRRETPDSRSPARPNLNIGLWRKVSQHPKQTEERISMHTSAIAVLSQISLSQKREAH